MKKSFRKRLFGVVRTDIAKYKLERPSLTDIYSGEARVPTVVVGRLPKKYRELISSLRTEIRRGGRK